MTAGVATRPLSETVGPHSPAGARIALHAEGVSVLLDCAGGQLPSIVHWGADLGDMADEHFDALAVADRSPNAPVLPDAVPHLAVLPEHWTGWTGRPGLSGSRAGRGWSPRFTTTRVTVDGREVTGLINAGAASVVVDAEDPVAALGLRITIELTAGGLVRSRAEVTNRDAEPYTVHDLVLAYPVPANAREILDFAGRWGKERTP